MTLRNPEGVRLAVIFFIIVSLALADSAGGPSISMREARKLQGSPTLSPTMTTTSSGTPSQSASVTPNATHTNATCAVHDPTSNSSVPAPNVVVTGFKGVAQLNFSGYGGRYGTGSCNDANGNAVNVQPGGVPHIYGLLTIYAFGQGSTQT